MTMLTCPQEQASHEPCAPQTLILQDWWVFCMGMASSHPKHCDYKKPKELLIPVSEQFPTFTSVYIMLHAWMVK